MSGHWPTPRVLAWRAFDFDPDRDYTAQELDDAAEMILKRDAMTNECPTCGEWEVDRRDSHPRCPSGHTWIRHPSLQRGWDHGTGRILSQDSEYHRRRPEVVSANGVPDPAIERGFYRRSHARDGETGRVTYQPKPAFGRPTER